MPLDVKNTQVLTKSGWKYANELTMEDEFAALQDDKLHYEKPTDIVFDVNYVGNMYTIQNQAVDLYTTDNHRMWISKLFSRKRTWLPFKYQTAREIMGRYMKYKKDAIWLAPEIQFNLPAVDELVERPVVMDSFLVLLGIWITAGKVNGGESTGAVEISTKKKSIKPSLLLALQKLGYDFHVDNNDRIFVYDNQLYCYLKTLDTEASERCLPEWFVDLSQNQARVLVTAMLLNYQSRGCDFYYTTSIKLADQFQHLLLHSGWAGMITTHIEAGNHVVNDDTVIEKFDILRISAVRTRLNPSVNHDHAKDYDISYETIRDDVKCPVFTVKVPSDLIYVRRNGKTIWTGC